MTAEAVVIVPVYNEASTLATLLEGLAHDTLAELRVVVVCNGCTDGSADVARSFPGIVVEELDRASKSEAIRRGEVLAEDRFPRFVVDADVRIGSADLRALIEAASVSTSVVVAPASTFETDGRPWLVRAYYFGLTNLPRRARWRATHVSGKGLYGLSREARARFGAFPDVRADDAYVDSLFSQEEREVVADATASVVVPETVASLVRTIARAKLANRELETTSTVAVGGPPDPTLDRRLTARVRRTVEVWRTSPLVERFDPWRTVPLVAGFYAVLWVAFAYRVAIVLRGREASWR